ncbi:hypothetical protein [Lachnoclostridium sp. Marseille-P6806]|uniref:hypothetical protein n=1 Tax=Lachnoclostridium sp. Marseille-P6806 TaxID=2364793 RepID=UPI00102F40AF|nr:hypothetical protein [Lachnoclostridium sp. Marseille-P6806]
MKRKHRTLAVVAGPAREPSGKLREYSRAELLEVIFLQSKKLEEQEEQLSALETERNERRIALQDAGNIAEASLQLSHIFADAEQAVVQYKENIERLSRDQRSLSLQLISDAQKKAEAILAEAKQEAEGIRLEAQRQNERSREEAERYWSDLSSRLEALYHERQGLREFVGLLAEKQTQS